MPVTKRIIGQVDLIEVLCLYVRKSKNRFRWATCLYEGVKIQVYCERSKPVKGEMMGIVMNDKLERWDAHC